MEINDVKLIMSDHVDQQFAFRIEKSRFGIDFCILDLNEKSLNDATFVCMKPETAVKIAKRLMEIVDGRETE